MTANRQLVLRRRPMAEVTPECFELVDGPRPEPARGEVLVQTLWLAFEPAQRGWLNDVPSYVPPVAIGEVMRAWGVGRVATSGDPRFAVGDLVQGLLGWQEWRAGRPDDPGLALEPVGPGVPDPKMALGVLGITGLTAYFGMLDVGRPATGDAVLVTSAAGATGSVAGQLARIAGAGRVIGTAGSEAKRAWVRDVAGFDDCVDHYDDKVRRLLREAQPDGYDVVFDNVGGALLDAALFNVGMRGRVVLCGSISTGYRPERPKIGLHYYQLLTTRRARMEGFIVTDYEDRFAAARADLLRWVEDGRLRFAHDVLEGLERAPEGLQRLFDGKNLGKQLLHVAD